MHSQNLIRLHDISEWNNAASRTWSKWKRIDVPDNLVEQWTTPTWDKLIRDVRTQDLHQHFSTMFRRKYVRLST